MPLLEETTFIVEQIREIATLKWKQDLYAIGLAKTVVLTTQVSIPRPCLQDCEGYQGF